MLQKRLRCSGKQKSAAVAKEGKQKVHGADHFFWMTKRQKRRREGYKRVKGEREAMWARVLPGWKIRRCCRCRCCCCCCCYALHSAVCLALALLVSSRGEGYNCWLLGWYMVWVRLSGVGGGVWWYNICWVGGGTNRGSEGQGRSTKGGVGWEVGGTAPMKTGGVLKRFCCVRRRGRKWTERGSGGLSFFPVLTFVG